MDTSFENGPKTGFFLFKPQAGTGQKLVYAEIVSKTKAGNRILKAIKSQVNAEVFVLNKAGELIAMWHAPHGVKASGVLIDHAVKYAKTADRFWSDPSNLARSWTNCEGPVLGGTFKELKGDTNRAAAAKKLGIEIKGAEFGKNWPAHVAIKNSQYHAQQGQKHAEEMARHEKAGRLQEASAHAAWRDRHNHQSGVLAEKGK